MSAAHKHVEKRKLDNLRPHPRQAALASEPSPGEIEEAPSRYCPTARCLAATRKSRPPGS